ncbi:tape measure protein [Mucilaginibacter sp. cycad4]|uniref:tape measure protein n=1 Tax=Mucilaginibacter sp. cycad4 TaxID=3342096 RepID=UPI002AABB671|nr:tape measure protein [Mucilaginibacter gossypii]WPU98382.1 tape measure protein [Mucilaginibacter gossypii]
MITLIQYSFVMHDAASAQMRLLAGNANAVFHTIGSRLGRIQGQVRRLDESIEALTKPRQISIDSSEIRMAGKELAELENHRASLATEIRMAGKELAEIESKQASIPPASEKKEEGDGEKKGSKLKELADKGLDSLVDLGKGLFKKAMAKETTGDEIAIIAGKKNGGNLKRGLNDFAESSGLGDDVLAEGKKMLTSGIAPENVLPGMKMLGDIALGDSERMKALSDVFAATANSGKLSADDLPKLIDAGFNPLLEMSRKTGKSTAELREDLDNGKISFQALVGSMQAATGPMGDFHDGLQRMGESPTGKIAALKGTLESMGVSMATSLLPVLGGAADVIGGLAANQSLMYGIAAGIGAMAAAWSLYTSWTQLATTWQAILDAAMLWPIVIIGVLVGAVVWLCSSFDGVGKSLMSMWQIIKSVFGMGKVLFMEFVDDYIFPFNLLYLTVKNIFLYIGQLAVNAAKAIKMALKGDFSGAKDMLTAHITTDAGKELNEAIHTRIRRANEHRKEIIGYAQTIADSSKGIGLTRHKSEKGSSIPGIMSMAGLGSNAIPGTGAPAAGSATHVPEVVTDTSKGIAGGGQRNQVINISKLGVDQISLHAASVPEGAAEIRAIFIEMFNQVINSGNAAVNPN